MNIIDKCPDCNSSDGFNATKQIEGYLDIVCVYCCYKIARYKGKFPGIKQSKYRQKETEQIDTDATDVKNQKNSNQFYCDKCEKLFTHYCYVESYRGTRYA